MDHAFLEEYERKERDNLHLNIVDRVGKLNTPIFQGASLDPEMWSKNHIFRDVYCNN
jgi:hypothetical protein